MKTDLLILRFCGAREARTVDMSEGCRYSEIRAVLRPILGSAYPEHVTVLFKARAADMFVHEDGHGEGLPRNDAATVIYRASWMERHPEDDPESLPWIAGDAVTFGPKVWS